MSRGHPSTTVLLFHCFMPFESLSQTVSKEGNGGHKAAGGGKGRGGGGGKARPTPARSANEGPRCRSQPPVGARQVHAGGQTRGSKTAGECKALPNTVGPTRVQDTAHKQRGAEQSCSSRARRNAQNRARRNQQRQGRPPPTRQGEQGGPACGRPTDSEAPHTRQGPTRSRGQVQAQGRGQTP